MQSVFKNWRDGHVRALIHKCKIKGCKYCLSTMEGWHQVTVKVFWRTRRLQTCSLWGSSPCSGSRSRAQSPQLGSPWAPPSPATPTLSHLATPEVAILLDADTINNNNAQMMRLLLERIRALSPGLVWRWLGGAGRLEQGGEGGVAARSCPSTFAVGHRSLSQPPNHPPSTHHPPTATPVPEPATSSSLDLLSSSFSLGYKAMM